jgi:hypothetical protein
LSNGGLKKFGWAPFPLKKKYISIKMEKYLLCVVTSAIDLVLFAVKNKLVIK